MLVAPTTSAATQVSGITGEGSAHWPWTTLGALCTEGLCELTTGPSWGRLKEPTPSQERATDMVELITPTSITDGGRIDAAQVKFLDVTAAQELPRYEVDRGDIVCVRQGMLGRQVLIGEEHVGWLFAPACIRIRLYGGCPFQPAYLLAFLRHPATRVWLKSQAVGQTVPTVTVETFRRLPVPVAPTEIQAAIVRSIAKVDAQMERYRRAASLMGELQATLMSEMFRGRVSAR